MTLNPGKMRHRVDVMGPASAYDERGQPIGKDEVYRRAVPCSVENLSGNEGEIARRNFPTATMTVRMYGDPGKPTTTKHYLLLNGTERRLEIGYVNDVNQNGVELELLCGEAKS